MASFKPIPLSHCNDNNSSNALRKVGNNDLGDKVALKVSHAIKKSIGEADTTEKTELFISPCDNELDLPSDEFTSLLQSQAHLEEPENQDASLVESCSLEESLGSRDLVVDDVVYSRRNEKSNLASNQPADNGSSYPNFRNKSNFINFHREGKTSDYSSLSSYNSRISEEDSQECKLNEHQKSLDSLPKRSHLIREESPLLSHEEAESSSLLQYSTTPTGSCLKGGVKSSGTIHVQFESPHQSREILSYETVVVNNGKAHVHNDTVISTELVPHEASPFSSLKKPKKKRRYVSGSSTMSIGSASTSTSDSRTTEFERKAPDGGWGWIVVFASFMVHCIADGITMSFGVLYVEFLSYFQESKSLTSWVGSLFMAIPLLAGPLASYVTDRFGCKAVTIWGSMFACLGFFVSAFANSLNILFLTVGIITGLGLAVCYVAAIVIVAFYFEKRRSLATGIAVAGSGIGTFVFAPVIQYLIKDWGWRGAMILLSGIILNMAVCGCLMRDLPWIKRKKDKNRAGSSRRVSTSQSFDTLRLGVESATPAIPSLNELRRLVESGEASNLLNPDELIPDVPRSSSLILIPTFLNHNKGIPQDLMSCFSTNINAYEIASKMYPHLLSHSLSRSLSKIDSLSKDSSHPHRPQHLHNQPSLQDEDHPQDSFRKAKKRRLSYQEELIKDLNIMLTSPVKNHAVGEEPHWQSPLQNGKHEIRRIPQDFQSPKYQHKLSLQPEPLRNMRVNRQSMTYRGAILNIYRYRLRASSCPNIYRNSIITIADSQTPSLRACLKDIGRLLWSCTSVEYFANVPYLIFSVSNFILYVFYDTVYMYMTDYAQGVGISGDDSADLISAIGILNCIGMVIMGCLGDQPWVSPLLIYTVSMIVCGISVIFIPFLSTYWTLAAAAAIFGFFISANYALTAVILVEIISLEAFSKSYGLLLLIQGIANLIGPPLVGFMADATGEYILPFVISGVFIVICGALLAFIPCSKMHRRGSSTSSESQIPEMKSLNACKEEAV